MPHLRGELDTAAERHSSEVVYSADIFPPNGSYLSLIFQESKPQYIIRFDDAKIRSLTECCKVKRSLPTLSDEIFRGSGSHHRKGYFVKRPRSIMYKMHRIMTAAVLISIVKRGKTLSLRSMTFRALFAIS